MPSFKLNPEFSPKANQEQAIKELVQATKNSITRQTLLGATGTGKTFLMAAAIEKLQRPTLVMAPNKTLAAQLYNEFQELLPDNAVEYFVSYYDYYQPEAYVVAQDLYIEKDASINEEIDRLRHSATSSLLTRDDTVVVSSVSCIYGIGPPEKYWENTLHLKKGESFERKAFLKELSEMLYTRDDSNLQRGGFRSSGEKLEIWPAGKKEALSVLFWGDEIEKLSIFDPLERKEREVEDFILSPASHYAIGEEEGKSATEKIKKELEGRLIELRLDGKSLEADRLEKRVLYDIEMIEEQGFVSGIENYSRILDGRKPGEPPCTLLDYFPDDYLCFLDESHITVPQIGGMYEGDRARKKTLVDHGFRLPSALDNRPLRFKEFLERVPQLICVSATPGEWEKKEAVQTSEQIVRPTGVLDPKVMVREKEGQMDNLLQEIKKREKKNERVLVTTLTKKMSEELADYLGEKGILVRYLHSDIDTLERIEILRDLRLGKFSTLVGVNLLREGLDLPEVSLVAILDADQEGFLRNERSLIQTIGRAARNENGEVVLYADEESPSMKRAIEETARRRRIQKEYNQEHGIKPRTIKKTIKPGKLQTSSVKSVSSDPHKARIQLEEEMARAAEELRFEDAAEARDALRELEKSVL